MHIETYYNGVEIHREEKIIYARFLRPHQVISTCRAAGGLRTDLEFVFNHQSCEPAGHGHRMNPSLWRDPDAYRRRTCAPYGLPAEKCATLGTAANMNHAAFVLERFRDLAVAAVCTGGVETNAGRVGDPASVVETPDGFETLPPAEDAPGPGTINTMVFIGKPLIPGALVRAIMTATEAKTAALQELAVNSRYSDGLATGTGTDQILAAAMQTDETPLTSAGKHAKLGELIGRAVHAAVRDTLARQNGLTPRGQCSAKIHLERFGLTRESMREAICVHLSPEAAALLRDNFIGVERDPVTAAAVMAMVHLRDKFAWGVLPAACWSEVMGGQAAQVAGAAAGRYADFDRYRRELAPARPENGNGAFLDLVCKALALGFADKWRTPEPEPGNPGNAETEGR